MTIPFDEKELDVVATVPNFNGTEPIAIYRYPVTPREGVLALYERKPLWQIMDCFDPGLSTFAPRVIPDNVARAQVLDGTTVPGVSNLAGGTDMFGCFWVFEPEIAGCMIMPGHPLVDDANDLEAKVVWPDIDSWDWAGAVEENKGFFDSNNYYMNMFVNGYFERLITLMDFEGALVALIDEDQHPAVQTFFSKLTDLYISIYDRLLEYFPKLDGVCFHDDWGGSNDTFFSPELAAEMIVPHMRRLTDHLHARGLYCDLHSCGNNYKQVENMVAAGWDSWTPQDINDTLKLYDDFGDKILIATIPELYDPKTTSEEEQRARARAYADRVCNPEKPSVSNMYGYLYHPIFTPAFREELYRQSRINYSRQGPHNHPARHKRIVGGNN
jgi:hypothetical protein